jgi:hypothetical protein
VIWADSMAGNRAWSKAGEAKASAQWPRAATDAIHVAV